MGIRACETPLPANTLDAYRSAGRKERALMPFLGLAHDPPPPAPAQIRSGSVKFVAKEVVRREGWRKAARNPANKRER